MLPEVIKIPLKHKYSRVENTYSGAENTYSAAVNIYSRAENIPIQGHITLQTVK